MVDFLSQQSSETLFSHFEDYVFFPLEELKEHCNDLRLDLNHVHVIFPVDVRAALLLSEDTQLLHLPINFCLLLLRHRLLELHLQRLSLRLWMLS